MINPVKFRLFFTLLLSIFFSWTFMKISTDKVSFYMKTFQFINSKNSIQFIYIFGRINIYVSHQSMSIPKTQWKMPDWKVMNEKAPSETSFQCEYTTLSISILYWYAPHTIFITTLTWLALFTYFPNHMIYFLRKIFNR